MILRPEGRIIRFGLGRSGNPASPLWRIWVQGNETYLAVRASIGISKVSLHSTGHWVLTTGSSTIQIKGPRTVGQNWKVGPRVVFAGVAPRVPLRTIEEAIRKRVFLFEPPPQGNWRDFAVLFSADSAQQGGQAQILPAGSDVVGPLVHRSGERLWLATFVTPMTSGQISDIRTEREKFRVHVKGDPNAIGSAAALLVRDTIDGDTMLINICLGGENIVVAEE